MAQADDRFDHLDAGGRGVAAVAREPRALVWTVAGAAVALAWAMLFTMSASVAGQEMPDWLPAFLPDALAQFLELCLGASPVAGGGLEQFFALWAMWMLMSVAMMLPSAAPLVRTYCEIADTARAKGEAVVHPLVLVGGYLGVWAAASAGFAALAMIAAAQGADGTRTPATGLFGAGALAIAGLYQFSGLKEACLKKCRRPFTILFARWSTKPAAILKLGAQQGLWCLGCCWALMLVMFAAGLMNIFWMALLSLFAAVEKQVGGKALSRTAGVILLVWSVALLVLSARVA